MSTNQLPQMSRQQAITFLWECLKELGGGFHPDDDFSDYMEVNAQSGVLTYSAEQAAVRNDKMQQVREALDEDEMYEILFFFEQHTADEPTGYQPDEFTRQLLAADVASEAEAAFWAVVAQRYPRVTSGDFPGDISEVLTNAVLLWAQSNTAATEE